MNWIVIGGLLVAWTALSCWPGRIARAWWLRPGVLHRCGDYTWGVIRADDIPNGRRVDL